MNRNPLNKESWGGACMFHVLPSLRTLRCTRQGMEESQRIYEVDLLSPRFNNVFGLLWISILGVLERYVVLFSSRLVFCLRLLLLVVLVEMLALVQDVVVFLCCRLQILHATVTHRLSCQTSSSCGVSSACTGFAFLSIYFVQSFSAYSSR